MHHQPEVRTILGIHHITAIAADPQRNLDFYIRFLGLRLVKRTVNFDDPGTYHFYYGDETGRPGTILTFFPWPEARNGRRGVGQVTLTSFAVPASSIPFWVERAQRYGVHVRTADERIGEPVLEVDDPDGLKVELIGIVDDTAGVATADIPADCSIRGIHSATLHERSDGPTSELLMEMMGFREVGREADRVRFAAGEGGPGAMVDVVVDPEGPRAVGGAGTVHHIAFRTPDDAQQERWQAELLRAGYQVSPVMDRNYFHSIYYREPGGILFEIATDPPGFLVDESLDELGSALKLPPEYESRRKQIEEVLPAITVPVSGLVTESY